jgi:DNA-binding transcriptional LysR family regulator
MEEIEMNGMLHVPLEWYGIFCAVAERGNITQAAEALFVSQPAVSMAIRQLEERLGHPLFIRSSKGVTLTPEGQLLYSYLSRALGLIDTAEKKYMEMTRLETGAIAIGAGDTLCSRYLLPYLEEYNRLYPGIGVSVTNRTSQETLELLKSGKVELGFVNLPVELDDTIEVRECMRIQDCLIGGSKYSGLLKNGLSLCDLKDYPLLMLETASASRRYLDQFASGNGVKLNPGIELGSSDLLIKFAVINLGLAFVIRELSKEFIDNETLFEIPLFPPPPSRSVGLVTLKKIPLSYAASAFLDILFK